MLRKIFALSAVVTACGFATASATSLINKKLDDLISESTVVAVGTATAQTTSEDAQGVNTYTTFNVSDAIIGTAKGDITIATKGGMIKRGNRQFLASYPGSTTFAVGAESLLFLNNAGSGNYRVVGWSQGQMAIVEINNGKFVDLPGDEQGPLSVAEAKKQILAIKNARKGGMRKGGNR